MKLPESLWIRIGIPVILVALFRFAITPAQTGDPIIDYLGLVTPYLAEILDFFQRILIPIGKSIGEDVIAPVVEILPSYDANNNTGFAIYFIIFAGIFLVSIYLNVLWRPNGYKKTKDKEQDEEREGESKDEIHSEEDLEKGSIEEKKELSAPLPSKTLPDVPEPADETPDDD